MKKITPHLRLFRIPPASERSEKENFGISSVPSKATFGRVLRMIDGAKVAKIMVNIMKEQLGETGEVLAVDGKAVRGTGKDGDPNTNLQIITAYLTEAAWFWDRKRFMRKRTKSRSFRKCWMI